MVLSGCAKCKVHVCQAGDINHGPAACPMHYDFPVSAELYIDKEIRDIARVAAQVESAGYRRWRRAEEIMEFSKRMGFCKLGVVFCSDMANVADLYIDVLKANGFETVAAGNPHRECNPVADAELCNESETQFNVLLGMHVGHDSLFISHSKAWVTSLVARDRVLVHNPVGALYGAKGYFKQSLHEHETEPVARHNADVSEKQLTAAAKNVINQGNDRWTRVEETMEFARKLGVTRLGLIFCGGFNAEASILTDILESNGFEVVSVACKTGAVPKEYVGVLDAEKVHPGKMEIMCNPLAQVEVLNRNQTELNILMGQCVGHDSLSIRRSKAPVVCLIAKDRVMAHNTVGALYESRGYLCSVLRRHKVK